MTWLLPVVAAPALALAGLWAWGLTRPAGHVATVRRVLPAPPDRVWAVVTDDAGHARWRTGLRSRSRAGTRIVEVDARGRALALEVEAEVPGRELRVRVVEQRAFGGTWTIALAPDPAGTAVTITERGELRSALLRALAPWFHDPEATARTWLADLARALGEEAG